MTSVKRVREVVRSATLVVLAFTLAVFAIVMIAGLASIALTLYLVCVGIKALGS